MKILDGQAGPKAIAPLEHILLILDPWHTSKAIT